MAKITINGVEYTLNKSFKTKGIGYYVDGKRVREKNPPHIIPKRVQY